VISSWVVVSLIFMFLFNSKGFSTTSSATCSGVDPNTAWLNRRIDGAARHRGLLGIWKGHRVVMLIYLAALQGIPKELLEAARIDGANARRWCAT
jgi:ABC-type sugar transport system permease subunit